MAQGTAFLGSHLGCLRIFADDQVRLGFVAADEGRKVENPGLRTQSRFKAFTPPLRHVRTVVRPTLFAFIPKPATLLFIPKHVAIKRVTKPFN